MDNKAAALCSLALGFVIVACMLFGAPAETPAVAAMSDLEFLGGLVLIAGVIGLVAYVVWWLMFGSIGR